MTIIKPLSDCSECIQVTLSDGQDEVRVHLHQDGKLDWRTEIVGLSIKNASRGLLLETGKVVGLECDNGLG